MAWRYFYDILGIDQTASPADVERAYGLLAGKYHPDLNPSPEAAERWAKISEAYAVLSDPTKRRLYDQRGHTGRADRDDLVARVRSSTPPPPQRPTDPPAARRGADLRCDLIISRHEAATGTVKMAEVWHRERCATCQGSGAAPRSQRAACPECRGSGKIHRVPVIAGAVSTATSCAQCAGTGSIPIARIDLPGNQGMLVNPPCQACHGWRSLSTSRQVRVTIPARSVHGQQIRLPGAGAPSHTGGPSGDLYVTLRVTPPGPT
jgi:molecular chaperone DnaJ